MISKVPAKSRDASAIIEAILGDGMAGGAEQDMQGGMMSTVAVSPEHGTRDVCLPAGGQTERKKVPVRL